MLQNPQISISKAFQQYNEIKLNEQLLRIEIHQKIQQFGQPWKLKQQQLCQYFNNYKPIPMSQISVSSLFKCQNLRLIRSENKIYFGQVEGKKKHGRGIAINREGKIYQGNFYNNEKKGYGVEIYLNGNIYFGGFDRNKKHGKGSFYWFSLTNNDNNDLQTIIEKYEGQWWGGLPDGQGTHQKINGDIYKGSFKNGLKHGDGLQTYWNGDRYKGGFINGLAQGYGEYFWGSGSIYKGDFKQGIRDGYGIWKKGGKSKESFKGNFKLNQKNGYGIYDWGNGYVYKGDFVKNIRHGKGQLYFNDELIYDGLWEYGQNQQKFNPDEDKKNKKTSKSKSKSKSNKKNANHSLSEKKYHLRSNFSASSKFKKQQSTYVGSLGQQQGSCGHKYGHKSCIPKNQFGKMPKPQWENPRLSWGSPLTPPKNSKRN